ncbi:MAG: DUF4258 domain-containing protein [Planctomycetota bacterium]
MPGKKRLSIRWTNHGRARARERRISLADVRAVVSNPTVRRDQDGGRIRVEKAVGARWIVVVVRPIAPDQVLVVTTFAGGE